MATSGEASAGQAVPTKLSSGLGSATSWRTLRWPNGTTLEVAMVGFDPASFAPRLFFDHGMALPPNIARSAPGRQAEYFHGRIAARAALRSLGVPPADLPVGRAGAPCWPEGLVGSISHTAGLAAAAVLPRALAAGVGVDLERVPGPEAAAAVASVALAAGELDLLESIDGPLDHEARIGLAFSAKESLYKAVFASVGRFFDFSAARVTAVDARAAQLTLALTRPLGPALPRGRRFEVAFAMLDARSVLTACVAGADIKPTASSR